MITQYASLTLKQQKLIDASESVMLNGYDPYSYFYVGSALLTQKQTVYVGTNINTCSYAGLCAERVAMGAAVAHGEYVFESIAIISKSDFFDITKLSGPCGTCRQMLWEFSELACRDIEILIVDTKKQQVLVTSIETLHPLGFGPRLCEANTEKYL